MRGNCTETGIPFENPDYIIEYIIKYVEHENIYNWSKTKVVGIVSSPSFVSI